MDRPVQPQAWGGFCMSRGDPFLPAAQDRKPSPLFWLRCPVFAARAKAACKNRPLPLLRLGCFVRRTRLGCAVPFRQNLPQNRALAARRLAHSLRQISLAVSHPSAHVGWMGRFGFYLLSAGWDRSERAGVWSGSSRFGLLHTILIVLLFLLCYTRIEFSVIARQAAGFKICKGRLWHVL